MGLIAGDYSTYGNPNVRGRSLSMRRELKDTRPGGEWRKLLADAATRRSDAPKSERSPVQFRGRSSKATEQVKPTQSVSTAELRSLLYAMGTPKTDVFDGQQEDARMAISGGQEQLGGGRGYDQWNTSGDQPTNALMQMSQMRQPPMPSPDERIPAEAPRKQLSAMDRIAPPDYSAFGEQDVGFGAEGQQQRPRASSDLLEGLDRTQPLPSPDERMPVEAPRKQLSDLLAGTSSENDARNKLKSLLKERAGGAYREGEFDNVDNLPIYSIYDMLMKIDH